MGGGIEEVTEAVVGGATEPADERPVVVSLCSIILIK
jgi:hypothetical protein